MVRTHLLHPDGIVNCDAKLHATVPDGATVWVDFESPTPEELVPLAERWHFHPLAIEDCVHEQKRSKFERYPSHGFLVLAALDRSTPAEPCDTVGICIFLRPGLVVTVHHGALASVEAVREALQKYPDQVGNSSERLLHAIVDAVIDEQTELMYEFETRVDLMESLASKPRDPEFMDSLMRVRRDLLALRRIVMPTREVVRRFSDADNPEMSAEGRMYFRDVLDHVEAISEATSLLLDVCNGAVQAHANAVNERLNQIMKYMAIVSTLLLPMTVISGAFGMNFADIPFAQHPHAFYLALGLMGLSTGILLAIFRARRWF
jgi:magnesium transporter